MINGERILQAREIRGLTQTELARDIGVSQSRVARAERGGADLSDKVHLLAMKTGFPVAFFYRDGAPDFPLGSLLFRSNTSLTKEMRARLRQKARLSFEIAVNMAKQFKSIDVHIQRISESPAVSAEVTRAALGLSPDTPITHLVNKLENAGILVLALPDEVPDHDAFSLWAEGLHRTPVIVVTGGKPGDRLRFSVAHELGHLAMHRTTFGGLAAYEREADQFASEFLMPRAAMLRELTEPVTLSSLATLKARWGVSIQALIMRALHLGIINENRRKHLLKLLATRYGRKNEPVVIPPEKPRLFRQMAEALYGVPIDVHRLAADLAAPSRTVANILSAHQERPGDTPAVSDTTGTESVKLLKFSS